MATYRVNVANREYVVDVTGDQIAVDGKPIQASLTPLNNDGLMMLRRDNRARELHVYQQGSGAYAVMVNGRHLVAQVQKNNGKQSKNKQQANAGAINAPMPGMVVNVLVEEGQHVNSGEPLIILESMKMQMQLRSPFAGQVAKIAVKDRAQVEKGTLLVQVAGD
ncbi:MAG: acetyl-CoA carboxylase biotin carboxyl carrier protein subunit [Chloroflexi bacterium]|nr:acetyl-CoA carboxylase biotin carboxyl carrier protein subunit [Chloroflexota bacterium]